VCLYQGYRSRVVALVRCLARITCLDDGFDFLGFTARRYHGKLITKPSKAAIKRVKKRLAAEMRALRGGNAAMILATINPITRGWANYYRAVASSRAYASLDHYMWQLTSKRAWHRHSHKPKHWITRRYFGRYNKSRQDRWVFGDRDRRLHAQARLDQDRPAPAGPGQGIPR